MLCINPIVFSETMFKVTFHIALEDGIKGVYDLKQNLSRYSWVYEEVKEKIDKMIQTKHQLFKKFLDRDEDIFKNETFSEYKISFEKLTETKNRKKKAYYKNLSTEEKNDLESKKLLKFILFSDFAFESFNSFLLKESSPKYKSPIAVAYFGFCNSLISLIILSVLG